MRVSILLAIILANAVISVNPVTGDVYVAQGGMGGNVNLSSGLVSGSAMNGFLSGSGMNGLVSSSGLNGLSVNANGLILNGQGLALGDGGNERIVSNQRLAIKPRYITERVNRKPICFSKYQCPLLSR